MIDFLDAVLITQTTQLSQRAKRIIISVTFDVLFFFKKLLDLFAVPRFGPRARLWVLEALSLSLSLCWGPS